LTINLLHLENRYKTDAYNNNNRLTALCARLPEVRDSEWQWRQLGHMQVCTLLQTDNHTSTTPLSFLQAGCLSCCPTNNVKALKTLRKKGKVFPYSLPSVGPGADLGVQAVSPQVT